MGKKELTKEIKLKIIEAAKKRYTDGGKWGGLCSCIIFNKSGIKFKGNNTPDCFPTNDCYLIGRYIPEFSITNAKRLSSKYNFLKPNGKAHEYWWNKYTKEGKQARVAFMDALLTEIQNKD